MQLLQGNCFDILPTLPYCTLIVADPPYKIQRTKGGGVIGRHTSLNRVQGELKRYDMVGGYDIGAFAQLVKEVQKGNINAYFFCNKAQIPQYLDVYVTRMKCGYSILVWQKTNVLPTYSNKYITDAEYCLHFHKGKGHTFPKTYKDAKTIYTAPINILDKKLYSHPTIKPLGLIEKLIRNSSKEGEIVLDPFMGSGTTGVAAQNLDRDFIGIELNSEYFWTAQNRIFNSKVT